MQKKKTKGKKVFLITLGCPKNEVDSEVWLSHLVNSGFEIANSPEEADFLFVNTCSFIEKARLESAETAKILSKYITRNSSKRIYMLGCWPRRDGARLFEKFPFLHGILDNWNIRSSFRAFISQMDTDKRIIHISKDPAYWYPIDHQSPQKQSYCYLKIADGCDNHCAYCTIPTIRGKFRSAPLELLISQARMMVDNGIKEIVLIAQDTTRYGMDIYGKPSLPKLIEAIHEIDGNFVIRIMYAHPARIDRNLIETISNLPKVAKYLDMPLQHYDDQILKSMRRGYSSCDIEKLLELIKGINDTIVLRTTFLVGFPGETDKIFDRLMNFIARGDFLHIGVFSFSTERGTIAEKLPDKVSSEVAELRRELIEMAADDIMIKTNERLIGNTVDALVDEQSIRERLFIARMKEDAPQVDRNIRLMASLECGQWVKVKIVKAFAKNLLGIVEET